MSSVQQPDPGDFPAVLPWRVRAGAAPLVPGNPAEIIRNLTALLRDIATNASIDRSFTWPTTDVPVPLQKVLHLMGPCGLLVREGRPARLTLTDDARRFLESGDELYLIAVIHANVRFIGEALASVADGTTHSDLNAVAADDYGLRWESLDQIRRRVYWLRAAGLVDFWTNGKIVVTERGRQFLERVELAHPDDLPHRRKSSGSDIELPPPPGLLAARLAELDQAALQARKVSTGYVAGGWRVESMSRLVNAAMPEITRSDFTDFCVSEFNVSESSAEQTLHTLRSLGLLVQVGADTFAATELGSTCLATGETLDFVRLLHLNIALLGETLDAIGDEAKSSTLVSVLADRYPGMKVTREETTRRIALLLETGLAERIGLVTRRTELGTELVKTLPLLDPAGVGASTIPGGGAGQEEPNVRPETEDGNGAWADVDLLAAEIVQAATDSADYQRFERAIAAAFRALGVDVEAHSGPKKTDVVIDLWQSPTSRLRVAVEAKTDGAGLVTDQDVKFWRLGEHRKRHEAQCTVLVGPRFDARVEQEAAKDKVAVLTAKQLADAIRRHRRTPLTPREISALVTVAEADTLEPTWRAAERRQDVLSRVLHTMWKSGNDPVDIEYSAGALGVRDIWRETKGALETPLDRSEIEEALVFLESPFIAAVTKHKDDHVSTAPPALIAARLRALAWAIESTSADGTPEGRTNLDSPAPSGSTHSETAQREPRAEGASAAVSPSLVRTWAKAQGRVVSERGRLPDGLVRDYKRAHGLLDE